jgi:taurine dioxygenase
VKTTAPTVGENWHSDICYAARPPCGSILYAIEVPDLYDLPLGDTEFASAAATWDALPAPTKDRINGRYAIFGFRAPGACHSLGWPDAGGGK